MQAMVVKGALGWGDVRRRSLGCPSPLISVKESMTTEAESVFAGIQGREIWWEGLSCLEGADWSRRRVWPWSRKGGIVGLGPAAVGDGWLLAGVGGFGRLVSGGWLMSAAPRAKQPRVAISRLIEVGFQAERLVLLGGWLV